MKFPEEQYKKWCKETKRNGGILIGSSVREFFEWLDESPSPSDRERENFSAVISKNIVQAAEIERLKGLMTEIHDLLYTNKNNEALVKLNHFVLNNL